MSRVSSGLSRLLQLAVLVSIKNCHELSNLSVSKIGGFHVPSNCLIIDVSVPEKVWLKSPPAITEFPLSASVCSYVLNISVCAFFPAPLSYASR